MKILKSKVNGYIVLKRTDKDGNEDSTVITEESLHELFETVFGGDLFTMIVDLQKIMWKNDDCMDWETLAEAQDKLASFALKYAGKLNLGGLNPKHVDDLVAKFPWLYEVQEKETAT